MHAHSQQTRTGPGSPSRSPHEEEEDVDGARVVGDIAPATYRRGSRDSGNTQHLSKAETSDAIPCSFSDFYAHPAARHRRRSSKLSIVFASRANRRTDGPTTLANHSNDNAHIVSLHNNEAVAAAAELTVEGRLAWLGIAVLRRVAIGTSGNRFIER